MMKCMKFRFLFQLITTLIVTVGVIWFAINQSLEEECNDIILLTKDSLHNNRIGSKIKDAIPTLSTNKYFHTSASIKKDWTIRKALSSLISYSRYDYVKTDSVTSYVRVKASTNEYKNRNRHHTINTRQELFVSVDDAIHFIQSKGFDVLLFQHDNSHTQLNRTSFCHQMFECLIQSNNDDDQEASVTNSITDPTINNDPFSYFDDFTRTDVNLNVDDDFKTKNQAEPPGYIIKKFLRNLDEELGYRIQEKNIYVNEGNRNQRRLETSVNSSNATILQDDEDEIGVSHTDWSNILRIGLSLLGAISCVCVAALAAGLTLGMLGLDPLMLLIKERAAIDPKERLMASKILPVVKKHHQLLVSLLLMNSIANEALPIFLEQSEILSPVASILISVVFVLFFGEIIPSAVFTGPNQLYIASNLVPLVQIVMTVLYPVAGPIAKLLDYVLRDTDENNQTQNNEGGGGGGHDEALFSKYNRLELAALIRIQYEERLATKHRNKVDRKNVRRSFRSMKTVPGDFSTIHHTIRNIENDVDRQIVLSHDELHRVMNVYQHHSSPSLGTTGSVAGTLGSEVAKLLHAKQEEGSSDTLTDTKYSSGPIDNDLSSKIESVRMAREDSIELDEVMMVEGALQMKTKVAFDVFTPIRNFYAIPKSMVLTEKNMVQIYASGYSRIPVYDDSVDSSTTPGSKKRRNPKSAIIGILVTKLLIVVDPKDNRTVGSLPLRTPQCVSPATPLYHLVNMFQTGGARGGHQAMVCASPSIGNQALLTKGACLPETAGLIGIITFEDVLETLLQEEIYDEMDLQHRAGHRLAELVVRRWRVHTAKKHNNNNQSTMNMEEGNNEDDSDNDDAAVTRKSNTSGLFFDETIPSESTALLGSK